MNYKEFVRIIKNYKEFLESTGRVSLIKETVHKKKEDMNPARRKGEGLPKMMVKGSFKKNLKTENNCATGSESNPPRLGQETDGS